MELILTLAMKFWQWTILIAVVIIGAIINFTDKRKKPNIKFNFKGFPELKPLVELMEAQGSKDGGRIGYQIGGNVSEEVMETAQDTGQVQDLTYTELRARLPQSVDDSVVKLLANSKQALLAFANIRDQQDVDQFNQTYGVDLNIPQEG